MITLRKEQDRGKADYGWLQSRHSFSFARYYDPKHMGFSSLRVINDDIVSGGAGFETHGHRDMEIISYVLSGSIEHKDSEGHKQVLPAGEFQLMSAGKGIFHSEFNGSNVLPLRFLQIWIEPSEAGGTPGYQQKDFGQNYGLTTIVTESGENGTLKIKQDAKLHQLIVKSGEQYELNVEQNRQYYVHLITGDLELNKQNLTAGDGAKITNESLLMFNNTGQTDLTALIFDLPKED